MPEQLDDIFIPAMENGSEQPSSMFHALHTLADQAVGVKLFTITAYDLEKGVSERRYTNMPDAYPVSGTKPLSPGKWSTIVLERHETFVANTISEIAEVFNDHALIHSLGCASVINVPVIVGGRNIGSINCLHEAGHYTPSRVQAAQFLKIPGAVCLLS